MKEKTLKTVILSFYVLKKKKKEENPLENLAEKRKPHGPSGILHSNGPNERAGAEADVQVDPE